MKKEILHIDRGQYLIDILPLIPTDIILNKRITGIGATYCELKSPRNSIIIEPTVPVIKGKLKDPEHKNVLGVFEGVKVEHILSYLSKRQKSYKLITTPESFYKIREAMAEMEINMHSNYFLLFDECERIVQDVAYRSNIALPMDDFFRFKNKAMVSATPIISEDPRFIENGFKILEINPTYPIKEDIRLITTNCILDTLKEVVQPKEQIFIFLNSTDTIHAIIKQMGIEKESTVFCSQKSVDKLKGRDFKSTFETWDIKHIKKYNFMTSRFYAALDIKLPFNPDVIMITDLNYAVHTMIDPNTEAIQIRGRFRNGIKSLTHITNTSNHYQITNRDEIKGYLRGCEEIYNKVKTIYEYAVSKNLSDAFGEA